MTDDEAHCSVSPICRDNIRTLAYTIASFGHTSYDQHMTGRVDDTCVNSSLMVKRIVSVDRESCSEYSDTGFGVFGKGDAEYIGAVITNSRHSKVSFIGL